MKKFISKFHYITQDLENKSHPEQAQLACQAGSKWIQYRCFSKTQTDKLQEASEIASICDDWGATLIITDDIELVSKADIQGVHIEDMDADFKKVRQIIGADKTLGASANTFEHILKIWESGAVDYVGCGPFAHTDTKPNKYPHLGISGYADIASKMLTQNIDLPLLAVGGIGIHDIDSIIKTGVYGIAVSAAVNKADDPSFAYRQIHRKVY